MRVSKSFAESLIDAVMQGRVPGMHHREASGEGEKISPDKSPWKHDGGGA